MTNNYLSKDKGQVTFTLKALTLIFSIIAFVMIVWQAQNFFSETAKDKQESTFEMESMSTLQKLINNEDCLAYAHKNTTQKGVIDKRKLEEFERNYEGIEPECARVLTYDYNIRVETLPMNFTVHQPAEGIPGGIFGDLLRIINGKKIVFLVDTSGSMRSAGGTYKGKNVDRLECAKVFLRKYIESLSDDSSVTVFAYGTRGYPRNDGCGGGGVVCRTIFGPSLGACGNQKIFGPLDLGNSNKKFLKNKLKPLSPTGCTPIASTLLNSFDFAEYNDLDLIVLLTDGCERCDGRPVCVAEKNKDKGIPVYTIGYGTEMICYNDLQRIAEITSGQSFRARTCEQLMRKIPEENVEIDKERWSFGVAESEGIGVSQFSTGDARQNSLTLSLPVSVRYGPQDYKRAVIYLEAVKGKLEKLSGYINRVCELGNKRNEDVEFSLRMSFNNPVKFESGKKPKICLMGSKKTCKLLDCKFDISFEDIEQEGEYIIRFEYNKNNDEVRVMS
ncbi:MAG: hypothetical protein ABEK17_04585 [Candidatus Aenigmatarchaeota archaeon]